MKLSGLYNKSPITVQNMACSLYSFQVRRTRYNNDFKTVLSKFAERRHWSESDICAFRDEKIRQMISHAYETVPFYRNLYKSKGIAPGDIRGLSDLHILPTVNKEIINANWSDFVSSRASDYKIVHKSTSGSTGAGFKILSTLDCEQAQWAATWLHYQAVGLDFDIWRGCFGSKKIVPAAQSKPPYWRILYPEKRLYFSGFHESDENLPFYCEAIAKHKLNWLCGYPSLITALAQFINSNGLSCRYPVECITTSAENLLEHQVKAMKKAFGAECYQLYGQVENVACFTEDKRHVVRVCEDFSAVEFIENELDTYDIIGTNLFNYAMPLIRYATNDTVTLKSENESDAVRVIDRIDGRKEDYVTLPSGERMGRLSSLMREAVNIREAQIYQKSDYSVIVYICGDELNCGAEVASISKSLREVFRDEIPVTCEYVDKIKKGNGNKLRFVVSEIKRPERDAAIEGYVQ